jgi:uncharacterized phage protein (TIGR02216 family)
MRAGLGLLQLAPAEFWAMTPRELDAALHGRLGRLTEPAALSRSEFEALSENYPDVPAGTGIQ